MIKTSLTPKQMIATYASHLLTILQITLHTCATLINILS